MIEAIEDGYIGAVMVKDMSRLGRDYLQVGIYTDQFFPEHGVRFIAVNDGVDSAEGENEFAPFRNIMNEWYARDISRKIRSSQRLRGNAGVPLSLPPYGYVKSPDNPKYWIVDEEAATVVRRIYQMCIDGYGIDKTAAIFEQEEILKPTEYWKMKGVRKPGRKPFSESPYHWSSNTVNKILTSREYMGDVVNFKTYSKSFKDKRRYENPEENHVIFEGVHTMTEVRTDNGYVLLKQDIEVVISQKESSESCTIYASDALGLIQNDPRYAKVIQSDADLKNIPQKHLEHKLLTASATVSGKNVNMTEDNGSANAEAPLTVVNTRGFDLPKTGDNGTMMFTIVGILLMVGAAVVLYAVSNKKSA